MSILMQLSSLALKGAAQAAGEIAGVAGVAAGVEGVVDVLKGRFADHSARLTRALERSARRAWRAVEIALAGRSWWDRCKVALASRDDKAIRQQVQAYLDAHPLDGVDGHGPDFRGQCLAQLHGARKAGLLDQGRLDPTELARRVGDLSRFGDPARQVEAEHRALDEVAGRLRREGYDALAAFLTLRPAGGPPLLLAAMRYFFQHELQKDEVLYRGLSYARLESLAEGQRTGFAGLAEALEKHGDRLEGLLAEVQAVVVETHANVLDLKAELARQGRQMQELGAAVLEALRLHQLERRELRGSDSLSVRDENERRLVRDLIQRYRALPDRERKTMPALLNAVGKLEVVSGEYEAAERDFRQLRQLVPDGAARAEAAHNAYRAALERRSWDEALVCLKEAVALDAARFAPFPVEKFEPERILGAGGFGVAFLCRNRHSSGRVVIKTLRRDGLDRDLGEVFREAQALEELEHPAIIRIRDCDYADAEKARPYFVMDYFPGQTLAEHVERGGTLRPDELLPLARLVAEGLQAAHGKGILHRDVKPANVLLSFSRGSQNREGAAVKLIDFGLALRATAAPSTMRASVDRTLLGSSIAGTLDYAAPEQMGKLKGVPVGTYSDVYGFAKTCCFALFGTPQPTYQHWQKLPRELADLLGRCLAEQPRERPQDFAAVLRELGGERSSSPPAPLPKGRSGDRMARADLDLPEVEEVLPVATASRSGLRRRVERPDDPAPPRSEGGRGIALALCLSLGIAAAGAFLLLGFGRRPAGPPTTSFLSPKQPPPPHEGGTTRVFEPIPSGEFPMVLEELQPLLDDPAAQVNEQHKVLAGRLAATAPTVAQRTKRAATAAAKQQVEMAKVGAASKKLAEAAFKKAQQVDDIWRISCAMVPLLKSRDLETRKLAAMACQKWGSPEDVPWLIGLLDADGYGADEVRINAAKALGHIKDKRGIEPVAKRLADTWDNSKGIVDALVAFGPQAEEAVWPYLQDSRSRKYAIEVLKQIGTRKSVPELKKLTQGTFPSREAAAAIRVIEARSPRAGSGGGSGGDDGA